MTLSHADRIRAGVETKRAKNRAVQPYDTVFRNGRWRVMRKADGSLLPGEHVLEASARAALNARVFAERRNFQKKSAN